MHSYIPHLLAPLHEVPIALLWLPALMLQNLERRRSRGTDSGVCHHWLVLQIFRQGEGEEGINRGWGEADQAQEGVEMAADGRHILCSLPYGAPHMVLFGSGPAQLWTEI